VSLDGKKEVVGTPAIKKEKSKNLEFFKRTTTLLPTKGK